MSRASASWRASLRIARRDAVRSKGRSALVAVMVGTPVLLAVMLSTFAATSDVSAEENLPATLGNAQARISWSGDGVVMQSPDGESWATDGDGSVDRGASAPSAHELADAEAIKEILPDARLVPVRNGWVPFLEEQDGFSAMELDTRDPATRGMVTTTAGRLPKSPGEIVVSPGLLRHLDQELGDTITLDNRDWTIIGVGTYGSVAQDLGRWSVVGLPGSGLLDEAAGADIEVPEVLVARDAPVTWDEVKQLNAAGFWVLSRDVVKNPPSESEQYDEIASWNEHAEEQAVLAIVVTAVVIQIVLLAGPAFAVGVRRQRRELALLAATGGSPADVRRVVLAQALVVGFGACVLAAGLGVALTKPVAALLVRGFDDAFAFGPFDVMWPAIVGAVVLGTAAAVIAAVSPARQVAKQDVVGVLAGRRGQMRASRGWPLVGLVLVAAGLAVCFTLGIRPGGEIAVAAGTIAVVLGVVFLTPLVIGLVGRFAAVLPLSLRLAVRDTARQRSRSAPAVAAVMATVAGITALAIANASDFEQNRLSYVYTALPGTATISLTNGADAEEVARRAADVAGRPFTPLVSAGRDGDVYWSYVEIEPWRGSEAYTLADIVVATSEDLEALGVALSPTEVQALNDGALLVDPTMTSTGGDVEVTINHEAYSSGEPQTRRLDVDLVEADLGLGDVPQGPAPRLARAVMLPRTAQAHQVPTSTSLLVAGPSVVGLDSDKAAALRASVEDLAGEGAVRVEDGFEETFTIQLLLLLGAGGVAVLIGTLTATGLALVDARPDFATLAAVGAAPRTRRTVAAAQAAVLGVLGALLGVAVGFAPGLAAAVPITSVHWGSMADDAPGPVIDIPWMVLATLVFVVPLIAALASAGFTRGRLPLTRRLAQ